MKLLENDLNIKNIIEKSLLFEKNIKYIVK